MNYPIPATPSESASSQKPVTEEVILSAVAGVILDARSQGRSLEDVLGEIMADDALLDVDQRRCLSELVAQAWEALP